MFSAVFKVASWSNRRSRIVCFTLGLLAALAARGDLSSASVADATATVTGAAPVTMNFPLTRTGDTSYDAWYSYYTTDDSAVAGTDYTAVIGAMRFAAGASTGQIPVTIAGANANQPDKSFHFSLVGGVGPSITPAFAAGQPVNIGPLSSAFATADFNGDGKPDLAGIGTNGIVTVELNNTATGSATATFAVSQGIGGSSFLQGITAADLNGDGKPDLIAVTGGGSAGIYVFFNNTAAGASSVSFGAAQFFSLQHVPLSVIAVDLNGDGKPDLALALQDSGQALVLINTTTPGSATASFATAQAFTVQAGPQSICAADIDGDGKLDLVTANTGQGTVSVLLNTTAPGSTTPAFATQVSVPVSAGPTWLAAADLNGDGKPDLVISDNGGGKAIVLLNTSTPGNAGFAPKQGIAVAGNSAFGVTIGDVNHDGRPDLVVVNSDTNNVSVLANVTAPGSMVAAFAPHADFPTGGFPYAVLLADFNGDGAPDIAALSADLGTAALLFNQTPLPAVPVLPGYTPAQSFNAGTHPSQLLVADFNNDGKPDLATTDPSSSNATVLLNATVPGSNTIAFPSAQTVPVMNTSNGGAVGDFNGDGKPDLAVTDFTDSVVTVSLNTTAAGAATASFSAAQPFGTGAAPQAAAVADFNGDGKPDLAVVNKGDSNVSVLLNTTASGAATPSFAAHADFGAGAGAGSIATADLNGDGRPDIVVANLTDATVSVLFNTTAPGAATPSFSAQQIFHTDAAPGSIVLRDVNGDGRPDVEVISTTGAQLDVLVNTTAPGAAIASFAAKQTFPSIAGAWGLTLGDVDGDGRPDAVITNNNNDDVSIMFNTTAAGSATVSFAAHQEVFFGGASEEGVAVVDLNGDGRPDLAAAVPAGGDIKLEANSQYAVSGHNLATGTIHYDVPTPGGLILNPDALFFTSYVVGKASPAQSVNLSNTSGAAIALTGFTVNGDFSQTNKCPASLGPGASCAVSVIFKPTAAGNRGGSLTIASGSGTQVVDLAGTGVAPVFDLTASPTSIDFGAENIGDTSQSQPVVLTNNGNAPVTITGVSPTSGGAGFSVASNTCSAPLAPGANCTYNFQFAPSESGNYEAIEQFATDQPGANVAVDLTGIGAGATAVLAPDVVDFGGQELGTSGLAKDLSLHNGGNVALTVSMISVTGEYQQSSNCPVTLAVGANCTISVLFSPTSAGADDGVLSVAGNFTTVTAQFSGNGTVPGIAVSPVKLAFGNHIQGTATTMSVTVTNSGAAVLNVGAPAVSGGNAGDFKLGANACAAPVNAGASCTIAVSFTPAAVGARSATLAIPSDAGATVNVSLGGTGTSGSTPPPPTSTGHVSGGGAFGAPLLGLFGLAALLRRVRRRAALRLAAVLGLAGTLLSLPAQALDLDGFYYGTRMGEAYSNLDGARLTQSLKASGYAATATGSGNGFAATAYAGYELFPHIALELGYTRTRDVQADLDAATVQSAKQAASLMGGVGDVYAVSLRYHGELLPRLSFNPRGGIYLYDTRTKVDVGGSHFEDSRTGGGLTVGAGLAYRIWGGLELGGGVDYFAAGHTRFTLLGGSLEWRFGAR